MAFAANMPNNSPSFETARRATSDFVSSIFSLNADFPQPIATEGPIERFFSFKGDHSMQFNGLSKALSIQTILFNADLRARDIDVSSSLGFSLISGANSVAGAVGRTLRTKKSASPIANAEYVNDSSEYKAFFV